VGRSRVGGFVAGVEKSRIGGSIAGVGNSRSGARRGTVRGRAIGGAPLPA
jgi:hypothetical protein